MSTLTKTIFSTIAALGFSTTAFAQSNQNDAHRQESLRTGVILEMDCGKFTNENVVELCIKSSAWEMADIASSTKDAIRQSGLRLGQKFALTQEIDDNCDPRKQLRNMDQQPQTLTEFRDATVEILEGCAATIRGNVRAANDTLADGGLVYVDFNKARLGLITEHTQWLSGLNLSEFEQQESAEAHVEQGENGFIIRLP